MNGKQTRIIAIANEKGGVGKTASVINLGAAFASEGRSVLIVDMDPQCNATSGLGIECGNGALTTYDLITNSETISVNDSVQNTQWPGLDLIPSHVDLAGAEVELINEIGRENRLREAFENLTKSYDIILLDTPPSLSLLTVNVFAFATEVLVPCQTQPYAFDALVGLFDTIRTIRKYINSGLAIAGIFATFYDRRTKISQTIMEKLQTDDRYKSLIYKTAIRANTAIAASADACQPVVFFKPESHGANDYSNLAKEYITRNFT